MSATLKVRVVPNARRDEVVGAYGDALKVKIQAPAMDGKANAALVEFLAGKLGISARQVTLVLGEKSRDKVIAIDGLAPEEIRALLGV